MERAAPSLAPGGMVRLQLRQSDFTTSARIVEAINRKFRRRRAVRQAGERRPGQHRGSAGLRRPRHRIPLGAGSLSVEADRPARVVINERTGTIMLGKDVHIPPVAILHGNLSVEIQTTYAVSQPGI